MFESKSMKKKTTNELKHLLKATFNQMCNGYVRVYIMQNEVFPQWSLPLAILHTLNADNN